MEIPVSIHEWRPSIGAIGNHEETNALRSGGCEFESSVQIYAVKESTWYNRVADYDNTEHYEYTEDGIFVTNCPSIFTGETAERKIAANVFFPAGSVVLSLNIKYEDLGDIDTSAVLTFCRFAVFNMVRKYGKGKVQMWGNDILYNGKKFYGEEIANYKDYCSISAIVTCEYEQYAEQFAKLKNHGEREITGITDEIPELTQNVVVQELYDAAVNIFNNRKDG